MTKVMRYENGKAITGQVDAPFKVDWSEWQTMTDAQKKGKKWLIENVPGAEGEIDADLLVPIWTNPSPTAAFAGQQITLASGDYDFLLVIGYHDISSSLRQINSIIEKGESGFLEEATQNYSRTITYISEKVLSIGNGYVGNTANNNVCVLTAIYGFKKTVKIKFDALAKDVSTLASKCMMPDGETSVADALNAKEVSRIELVTLTVTTGTGSGAGAAGIEKSSYPNSKALIPFGLDTTLAYRVALYNEYETSYRVGVTTIAGQWVSGTTLTFKAYVIY